MRTFIILWILGMLGPASAYAEDSPLWLPFWDAQDIREPAGGRIEFRAEVLQPGGIAQGYPQMQYGCSVPAADGATWIYGWKLLNFQDRPRRTIEVVRLLTRDGLAFTAEERLWSVTDSDWQGFVNIVHRPTDGALFLLSYAAGRLQVWRSDDGRQFQRVTEKAYVDHDAMCVTWHLPSAQFVNYQNTLEKFAKRYPDNIGNYRRVFAFRKSQDGVHWESFSPAFLQAAPHWRPDQEDPVDLEFYRGIAFPSQKRFAMLIQNYIAPPPEANSRRATTKHGPRSAVEWAISRDGFNWSRPHRELDATERVGGLPVQGPLTMGGVHRFYQPGGGIAAVPVDRIFYATCRGNGELTTPTLSMPPRGLQLNAQVLYHPSEGDAGRAYLMAELRDSTGKTIPGYERQRRLVANRDGIALPLQWEGKSGTELAGTTVAVRLYFRDAKLYSISAVP